MQSEDTVGLFPFPLPDCHPKPKFQNLIQLDSSEVSLEENCFIARTCLVLKEMEERTLKCSCAKVKRGCDV